MKQVAAQRREGIEASGSFDSESLRLDEPNIPPKENEKTLD